MSHIKSPFRRWPTISLLAIIELVGAASLSCFGQKSQDNPSYGLRVRIALLGEKFCYGTDEIDTQMLDLSMRFANAGKSPITIILGTYSAPLVLIARSEDDLKAGKYEVDMEGDFLTSEDGRYLLSPRPQKERPVLLRPGESVEDHENSEIGVFVRKPSASRIPGGTITSGKHFIQVGILIRVVQGDKKKLAARPAGQSEKYVWASVKSQAVSFETPQKITVQDCPKD